MPDREVPHDTVQRPLQAPEAHALAAQRDARRLALGPVVVDDLAVLASNARGSPRSACARARRSGAAWTASGGGRDRRTRPSVAAAAGPGRRACGGGRRGDLGHDAPRAGMYVAAAGEEAVDGETLRAAGEDAAGAGGLPGDLAQQRRELRALCGQAPHLRCSDHCRRPKEQVPAADARRRRRGEVPGFDKRAAGPAVRLLEARAQRGVALCREVVGSGQASASGIDEAANEVMTSRRHRGPRSMASAILRRPPCRR